MFALFIELFNKQAPTKRFLSGDSHNRLVAYPLFSKKACSVNRAVMKSCFGKQAVREKRRRENQVERGGGGSGSEGVNMPTGCWPITGTDIILLLLQRTNN